MKIKNALIIHGPGRSGTTLLVNILALHEKIGWLSSYVDRFPKYPILTSFNKMQEVSAFEVWNRNKTKFPRPSEAYNFWLHHVPEFNKAELQTISKESAYAAQKYISKIKKYSGKPIFMTKITGLSRHQTLDAVFEQPKIVWIDRNPLAVIASYYKQRWDYKNKPKAFEATLKTDLIKHYTAKYKLFQDDKNNLKKFPILEVKYQDLINNRHEVISTICEFTNIPYSSKFRKAVDNWLIKEGSNKAYKNLFSNEDINLIESILK